MSFIKSFFAAFALLTSAVVVAAPVASAQATTVIVIDEGKILRDSRAGKDLQNKLKNIEAQMKRELDPTRNSLQSEGKSLESRTQGKTPQQVQADAALMSSVQAFQKKAQDFAIKRQRTAQEYALTERKGLQEFNKLLEPVLSEVVREKNAQLVMSRSAVVFSGTSIDATASVISKLDSRSPTVNVTRQRAPTQ